MFNDMIFSNVAQWKKITLQIMNYMTDNSKTKMTDDEITCTVKSCLGTPQPTYCV